MAERTDVATRLHPAGDASERTAREIRQDIAAKRESISETVDKLGERIHETLDWREYVGQYPYVALGAAAGIGFLVSGLFKRRPAPSERIVDALADTIEDFTDRLRDSMSDVVPKKMGPGKTVKAAITGAVATAATNYIKNQLSNRFFGNRDGARADLQAGEVDYAPDMRARGQQGF